jgi:hypothetical protein
MLEIIRLLLCFFSDLYFPPKYSGKNIRSASGFFIAGNPFIKIPGWDYGILPPSSIKGLPTDKNS